MKNQGFTLIELLVVVAIIGILATVITASLSSGRTQAKNAAIKAELLNLRTAAEIVYTTDGSYANLCNSGNNGKEIYDDALSKSPGGGMCNAAAESWAAAIQLNDSPGYWCVDYLGVSRYRGSNLDHMNDHTC